MDDQTFERFVGRMVEECGVQDEFDELIEDVKKTMKVHQREDEGEIITGRVVTSSSYQNQNMQTTTTKSKKSKLDSKNFKKVEFGEIHENDDKEEKQWQSYLEAYYRIYKTGAKDRFKSNNKEQILSADHFIPGLFYLYYS
jgi:hypothetical protein